jgi:sugar (pentulose or hexulose) kinase
VSGTPKSDVFVGIDLGTSALKGVAISADGSLIASARRSYATHRPAPGRAEQDPADWLSALAEVVADLTAQVPSDSWSGVGMSGMIPTLVTLDDRGEPNGPAITWEDARAETEGEELRNAIGGDELYARTGQWVDGRYVLPMFRWIERHDRERAASTAAMLGAKDFLFAWLTGERATDPSTATGFGCYDLGDGRWVDELVLDVALSDVRESSYAARLLDDRAEELGLPGGVGVTLGAADSVCAALGIGAAEPGACAYIWGTSTVVLGVAPELRVDRAHRFLVTPLASGNTFGLEMDLLSTGAALAWVAALFGVDGPSEVLRLAERSSPGANGITFLPYLAFGEQGALWDPDLRGALDGLTIAHTREDVARALVEAIAVESRRTVEVLAESDVAAREIRATGPIVHERFLLQQLANSTGCAVVPVELPSAAAAGAASIASGTSPPLVAATLIEPDPATSPFWEEQRERIDGLREQLRG